MEVLCKDSLNFKFDVSVLLSVNRENIESIKDMFENLKPKEDNTITASQVFETYADNVIDQESRKVVSKYETSEIVSNRKKIIEEIGVSIKEALKDSVIKIKRVTVNNLDFPPVVTLAQEDRAKREVEIDTERAEQKKRLLQAENQLKIAEMEYKIHLVESAMIADANKIIGASITPEYLAWWQLKVLTDAAQGPNNWGFIPYSDFAGGAIGNPKDWASKEMIVDQELRKRIDEARSQAAKPVPEPVLEDSKGAPTPEVPPT